ncbi:hypothetical protein CBL_07381 [Carabus blaptoides fortunei]
MDRRVPELSTTVRANLKTGDDKNRKNKQVKRYYYGLWVQRKSTNHIEPVEGVLIWHGNKGIQENILQRTLDQMMRTTVSNGGVVFRLTIIAARNEIFYVYVY